MYPHRAKTNRLGHMNFRIALPEDVRNGCYIVPRRITHKTAYDTVTLNEVDWKVPYIPLTGSVRIPLLDRIIPGSKPDEYQLRNMLVVLDPDLIADYELYNTVWRDVNERVGCDESMDYGKHHADMIHLTRQEYVSAKRAQKITKLGV